MGKHSKIKNIPPSLPNELTSILQQQSPDPTQPRYQVNPRKPGPFLPSGKRFFLLKEVVV